MWISQFSRRTFFEACTFLGESFRYHGEFEDLMYRWELDFLAEKQSPGAKHQRCRELFKFLKDKPEQQYDGRLLIDLVVEEAASRHYSSSADQFTNALQQDGFVFDESHQLRRALPELINLPEIDDEVHALLKRCALPTTLGHLDQAIDAHTRGNWAGANSQLRTCFEAFFDEVYTFLNPAPAKPATTCENRRQVLANMPDPFLDRALNEWSDDGKNFINGTLKRLHPQGSHPGLSDPEDSTFRLHLVLLTLLIFLRRLAART